MEELLSAVKNLSPIKQRAVAGLLGAVVADAAGSPLLWIYKDEDMIKAVSSHPDAPEFHNPSSNPFYRVPCGSLSHYGDQILPILRSVAECNDFDPSNYNDQLIKAFGKDSSYHRDYSGNVKYPIDGPYQNSTIKRYNELYPLGKTAIDVPNDANNEPDCVGRIIPVVLRWTGSKELHTIVEHSTTLLQSNETVLTVVGVVSRLMELYILQGEQESGTTVVELIKTLRSSTDNDQKEFAELMQSVIDSKQLSVKDATKKFGNACALPGSLQSSIRSLLDAKDYVTTMREIILAGGSNCSRLILNGFCLGAKYGLEGIPRDWIDRTNAAREVLSLALQIIDKQ